MSVITYMYAGSPCRLFRAAVCTVFASHTRCQQSGDPYFKLSKPAK